jgi:hypothetical protein
MVCQALSFNRAVELKKETATNYAADRGLILLSGARDAASGRS